MHFNIKLLLVSAMLVCAPCVASYAQMSDEAIISFLKEGVASGKSESQLGSELMARGVSPSQLKRLLKSYQSSENTTIAAQNTVRIDKQNPRAQKALEEAPVVATPSAAPAVKSSFYGHSMFNSKALSFEPNENVATPVNYVLGPGDELIIDVWGKSEASISRTISPEGYIQISQVGRLNVSGLTLKQAQDKIRKAMTKIYSNLATDSADFSVTLGTIRTIQVNILGEVAVPGTYRLSAFSTVFNALYRAGGLTENGSMRAVRLVRAGRQIAVIDVYKFLFDGAQNVNQPLREGDVIIVPVFEKGVKVRGAVKRPLNYELGSAETLKDAIRYAGGFAADAYHNDIQVVRTSDKAELEFYSVDYDKAGAFAIADGDYIYVENRDTVRYANAVEVRGNVYRPGKFELGGDIATVKQLVAHAGGLRPDAFPERAQIIREKADRSIELIPVAVGSIVSGEAEDVVLKSNDVLVVYDKNKLDPKGDITISGFVANPGKYEYAEHTTVEDIILVAGGLSEGASMCNVEVARRIIDPQSTESPAQSVEIFNFAIKDGFVVDGEAGFELKPYDVVAVRKSPSYEEQKLVSIVGEVNFPGQYALTGDEDRISDIIERAGGITQSGYLKGGLLKRKIDQYERNTRENMSKLMQAQSGKDTLDKKKLMVSSVYSVGTRMDKAMAHPGCNDDLILRDGDEIVIPSMPTTVRIQGSVSYPNTVHYVAGKSLGYYIRQAGGYARLARRSQVYVVYANGTASVGSSSKIEPGCEIIVPEKPEPREMTTGEILSLGSSVASITAMVVTIINSVK